MWLRWVSVIILYSLDIHVCLDCINKVLAIFDWWKTISISKFDSKSSNVILNRKKLPSDADCVLLVPNNLTPMPCLFIYFEKEFCSPRPTLLLVLNTPLFFYYSFFFWEKPEKLSWNKVLNNLCFYVSNTVDNFKRSNLILKNKHCIIQEQHCCNSNPTERKEVLHHSTLKR